MRGGRWLAGLAALVAVLTVAVIVRVEAPSAVLRPMVATTGVVGATGDTTVRAADGATVHVRAGSLPGGATLAVAPVAAGPPLAGLSATAGHSWTVTASTALTGPADLALPYRDDGAVPTARPLVAYLDPRIGLWLPVPTTVDSHAHLATAQVAHFSTWTVLWDRITAGATSAARSAATAAVDAWDRATNAVGTSMEWLSYQVNRWAFAARADRPTCAAAPPPWVTTVEGVEGVNAFLYVCGESADGGRLRLRVVNNRAVPLALPLPAAPLVAELVTNPGEGLQAAFDQTFFNAWKSATGAGSLYLPPLSTTLVEFAQPAGTAAVGTWSFIGAYNPMLSLASLFLSQLEDRLDDAAIAAAPGGNAVLVKVMGCVAVKVAAPTIGQNIIAVPATWPDIVLSAVSGCLDTAAGSAVADITAAAQQSVDSHGQVSKSVADVAARAEKVRLALADFAAAVAVYQVGGFTIEGELAQAQQLGRFYVVYTTLVGPATFSFDGYGRVTIGMTEAQARAAASVPVAGSGREGGCTVLSLGQDRPSIIVREGRVTMIETYGSGSTDRGIRVGSTLAEVQAAYPEPHTTELAQGLDPSFSYEGPHGNTLGIAFDPTGETVIGIGVGGRGYVLGFEYCSD